MRRTTSLLIVLVLLFSSPSFVGAHETGASLEAEEGGYFIDIGYNPEQIVERESAVFDFSLKKEDSVQEFDFAWVRISNGGKTVLATGIGKSEFGRTVLTYAFPEAGLYEIDVRFQQGTQTLAEQAFPISVEQGSEKDQQDSIVLGGVFAGACLGGAGVFLAMKRRG